MSKKANEIFDYAKRKREEAAKEAYISLKEKAVSSVTEMMDEGEYFTEFELSDKDMLAVHEFTKELHNLDYHYCLIEVQDETEDVLSYKLRVSIAHLNN